MQLSLSNLISDTRKQLTVDVIGLALPTETTIAQWAAVGERIKGFVRVTPWIVGDWLNFGENSFGESYSQYADSCGYDPGSLASYQSVCRRFAPGMRDPDVSFSHYRLLAKIESDKEVAKWIKTIKEDNLSVSQLRAMLGGGDGKEVSFTASSGPKVTAKWVGTIDQDDAEAIEVYLKKKGADRIKWSGIE